MEIAFELCGECNKKCLCIGSYDSSGQRQGNDFLCLKCIEKLIDELRNKINEEQHKEI